MAAITTAPSERTVTGPVVHRSYTLTGVGNGDTLAVPLIRILGIAATATTDVAVGATISGSTITFALAGSTNMLLDVWGREG